METADLHPARTSRNCWWAAVLIPLLLGFALRLRYLLQAEPFVDEPTTMLVAQAIAATGLPTLPSGLFYGNDLPFSYLAGGLMALFGPHLIVLRLLSLAASVVGIALLYRVGATVFRRLDAEVAQAEGGETWVDSRWIGLWAATLLALDPTAILWGGRARAYALLGLLVLLAVWLFYTGVVAEQRRLRWLGLLVLVIAVYVHPEAGLVLPALVVATMAVKGARWWLRWDRLAELLVAAAAAGSRWWLQTLLAQGRIGAFETLAGSRPPVELGTDLLSRLSEVLPFFVSAERLAWTLLALLALVGAVWQASRRQCHSDCRAVVFFSICLWLVPVEMILLLGSTYQSPRYLTMLLPIFALVAAWGLGWGVSSAMRLARRGHSAVPAVAVLASVALVIAFLPGAYAASNTQEKGFRSAFEVVKEQWQAGDRSATVAPAYCQMVLGHCDLFTLGLDYEEFVYRAAPGMQGDGGWVDRWLGKPLIRTAEEMADAIDDGGRLWFVTDESRLRNRFDPAFAQMVWERMELVSKDGGVLVFRSLDAPETTVHRAVGATWASPEGQVRLEAYDLPGLAGRPGGLEDHPLAEPAWGEVVASAGESLPLTLYWQAVSPMTESYTAFVHLVGPDGQRHAQADGPALNGIHAMTDWQVGEILPDRRAVELPADLSPGRYRLEVGLYPPDGNQRLPVTGGAGEALGEVLVLDYVVVPGASTSPAQSMEAELRDGDGDRVRLLGYTLPAPGSPEGQPSAAPGSTLEVTLYWQAAGPVDSDYTVFVHLLDDQDEIRGQGDGPPSGGFYPTSFWDPGEIVADVHQVTVDADAPPGTYRLAVGLYRPATGERLTTEGGDRVEVGEVQIQP